jgi:hypothetical protein
MMNEEFIKSLAMQNERIFNLYTIGPVQRAEVEQFVEAIVMQCLNICEDMGDNGKDGHYCADEISRKFFQR